MSLTAKQQMRWSWKGGVRTDKHERELSPGELTVAKNVRRPKDGPPRKRNGYDRTAISTFNGGTYAGPCTEMLPHDALLFRDTSSQWWVKNETDGEGHFRGQDLRATPRWFRTENQANFGRAHKPLAVMVDSDLWVFSLGTEVAGTTGYQLTIVDPVTRLTKNETRKVAADGIVMYAVVVDDSSNVWLFYITHTARETIIAHKFTSAAASPTITTYNTGSGGGVNCTSIDAHKLANGTIVVAASLLETLGGFHFFGHYVSLLDTGTGAMAVGAIFTPAGVVDTNLGVTGGMCIFGTGASNVFYLSYWRPDSAANKGQVTLQAINATTMGNTELSLATFDQTPDTTIVLGTTGGHLAANGDRVVYASLSLDPTNSADGGPSCVTNRYTYNGSSTATFECGRSAWLASRPFQVGSSWYFITGFDAGVDEPLQKGYFLRSADGEIITTILHREGAGIFHAGGLVDPPDPSGEYVYPDYSSHVVTPIVSGTDVIVPLMSEGLTLTSPSPTVVTISTAGETYHSAAPGVSPGGVAKLVGKSDAVRELAPLHFPYTPVFLINDGGEVTVHSTNVVTIAYGTKDSDDKVTWSAPYPLSTVIFHVYTAGEGGPSPLYVLRLPTLRHVIGPTWIGLFGSVDGGTDPYLQKFFANDPTVDTIDLDVYPLDWDDSGELLYSFGAALENESPPPCRLAMVHGDRTVLGGTPDDRIWTSQVYQDARGAEFNAALAFRWPEGTGELLAFASDGEAGMVLFRQDKIARVPGKGLDGIALNGAWEAVSLPGADGCDNPASVVSGPLGVYFQRKGDGKVCLVSGQQVTPISQGFDAYRSEVITAAVHDSTKGVLRFSCASGKRLILDYTRPLPDQPAGQWYEDNSSPLTAAPAVGCQLIDGVPVEMEAGTAGATASWQQGSGWSDNGTAVLTDWTTGPFQPAQPLGEFDTFEMQLSSTKLGGDSAYAYTLTDSVGNTEAHPDVANATADVAFMTGLNRTRHFTLRIQETSATGEGREFDGGVVEVGVYKRPQDARRRIG